MIGSTDPYAASPIAAAHEPIYPVFLAAKLVENVHCLSYAEFIGLLQFLQRVLGIWRAMCIVFSLLTKKCDSKSELPKALRLPSG